MAYLIRFFVLVTQHLGKRWEVHGSMWVNEESSGLLSEATAHPREDNDHHDNTQDQQYHIEHHFVCVCVCECVCVCVCVSVCVCVCV